MFCRGNPSLRTRARFALALAAACARGGAVPAGADDASALLAKHRAYVGWQAGDGAVTTLRESGDVTFEGTVRERSTRCTAVSSSASARFSAGRLHRPHPVDVEPERVHGAQHRRTGALHRDIRGDLRRGLDREPATAAASCRAWISARSPTRPCRRARRRLSRRLSGDDAPQIARGALATGRRH